MIFDRNLDPERIIKELSVRAGESIFKEDTLIIFDEIQVCERALTSLKYFCENATQYHTIAVASLLGVALNREKYFFPVGKVDLFTIYPLDFEEFLWAMGKRDLSALIRESFANDEPFSLHDHALIYTGLILSSAGCQGQFWIILKQGIIILFWLHKKILMLPISLIWLNMQQQMKLRKLWEHLIVFQLRSLFIGNPKGGQRLIFLSGTVKETLSR